jgi:hypothetical protein
MSARAASLGDQLADKFTWIRLPFHKNSASIDELLAGDVCITEFTNQFRR